MNESLQILSQQAWKAWRQFVVECDVQNILKPLTPQASALGIKVADEIELLKVFGRYFQLGDQAHWGPVNGVRTVTTIRKPAPFALTMRHVKLLQRRPGRDDALGLEHLDLLIQAGSDLAAIELALKKRSVDCAIEQNNAHSWLSIRHHDFEFKLVDHEVWSVCVAEAAAG